MRLGGGRRDFLGYLQGDSDLQGAVGTEEWSPSPQAWGQRCRRKWGGGGVEQELAKAYIEQSGGALCGGGPRVGGRKRSQVGQDWSWGETPVS